MYYSCLVQLFANGVVRGEKKTVYFEQITVSVCAFIILCMRTLLTLCYFNKIINKIIYTYISNYLYILLKFSEHVKTGIFFILYIWYL